MYHRVAYSSWPDLPFLVPEREPELYLGRCRQVVADSFKNTAQGLLKRRFRHSFRVNPSPWRKLWGDANNERKRFLTVKTAKKLANKRDYLEAFFKECGKEQAWTNPPPFTFWIVQMAMLAGSSEPREQEYVWRQVAGEGAFLGEDEIFLDELADAFCTTMISHSF